MIITTTTAAATLTTLRAQAEQHHAAYPQYRGYWDGATLARVRRDVRTKLGAAFLKGDLVLLLPGVRRPDSGPCAGIAFVTAYSARNLANTSIREAWIERL